MRGPFRLIGSIAALVGIVILIGLAVLVFGRADETVEAPGVVEPARTVDVKPRVDGIVEKVLVREGDVVRAGDTLAVLRSDELAFAAERTKQALEAAVASLASLREEYDNLVKSRSFETQSEFANLYQAKRTEETAKEKYDRAQSLYKERLISVEEMNDTRLAYELAQANYRALEQRANLLERRYVLQIREKEKEVSLARREHDLALTKLAETVVTAPLAGAVLTPRVEELAGEKALEGKALVELGDLTGMIFAAAVDEGDMPRVEPRQTAKIFLTAFPHRKYKAFAGEVVSVSPKPALTGGAVAFETRIRIDDPTVDLGATVVPIRPGLSGKAKIAVRRDVRLIRIVFGMKD